MATLIKPDGTVLNVVPYDGKAFTLKEMYFLVETDIVEYVTLGDEVLIICEEGKIRGKPINKAATIIALARGWRPVPGDFGIVGNALHCDLNEVR